MACNSAQLTSIGCLLFFSCLFYQFSGSISNQAADLIVCASVCNNPVDIAIDPTNDDLYIADHGNNRVSRFGPISTLPTNSPAIAVFGQPNFGSNTPGGGPGGLNSPWGIFVDQEGTLWASDGGNNRVLWFHNVSQRLNGSSADGVLGQADFSQNSPGLGATGMDAPVGLLVDQYGSLWVVDSSHHRVLRFDNASTLSNGSAASGVLGQPTFDSYQPGLAPNGMYGPNKLNIAPDGSLFVADDYNNRIVSISLPPPPQTNFV